MAVEQKLLVRLIHTDTCKVSSSPVEAQVPLADHVCGVAGLAEPLGQSVHV